jgi:hypothetical protein
MTKAPAVSKREMGVLALALGLGLFIAWMDSRPHWDDTGITAASLLLSAGLTGFLARRRPWLLGLAVGLWVPLTVIAQHPSIASLAGGLVILSIPMAGAFAGAGLRRMLAAAG